MAKISPEQAKKKFQEHLKEITKLKNMNYKKSKTLIDPLNQKIISLINLSFDDAKNKLSNYNRTPGYFVTTSMTEKEMEENSRNYYKRLFEQKENLIVGYLEEINLLLETRKQNTKLDKIEEDFKENL